MTIRAQIIGRSPVPALRAMRERVEHMQPIMSRIGDELVFSTRERIDRSVSPDGTPFKQVIRGGKPLRDSSAHIYSALHSRATNDAVLVGVPYAWARVHQYGATIRAKNVPWLRFMIRGKGWVTKKQVTIPARPWLGLSAQDSRSIFTIVRNAVTAMAARA